MELFLIIMAIIMPLWVVGSTAVATATNQAFADHRLPFWYRSVYAVENRFVRGAHAHRITSHEYMRTATR